ncbi:MAG: hypothetical protein IJ418_09130 [Clostridia bacterium]|nr:hypothetical protein [Clostridia bacterium]
MALDIIQPMRFEIDLRDGLVQKPQRTQLMKGDKNANRVVIALTDGGKAVDLTGATVTGSFISPVEEAKIPLTGSVNGSEASVTLIEECYAEDGFYQLDVELTVGETRRTIASMTGYVLRKGSGAVIDIGDVIPSLDDIIAQYATMKQVTQETQTAADNANAARDGANEAEKNANAAADAANEAAQAADGWANAEMTAETLAQGSAATTEVTTGADGHKIIKLGIPRGDTGLTPQITFDVSTGAAGTDVQIEQSGTPEAPVIHLTIPRGDTGSVDGIDYYEGDPAPLGEASPGTANGLARGDHVHPMPTAEAVGALPSDGTAAAATKLETARTIRTDLGSTSEASFDGTANITPGVTGSLPIANGGTGATTRKDAFNALSFLGTNPITTQADDTTANWNALGSGFAWYNTSELLTDQPSQYGYLINYTTNVNVFQIWNKQSGGATYFRSGNAAGWDGGWRKAYDSTHKPTPADIGALPDYGRDATLWSGSWSSGTITVPNTANYSVFIIEMQGQGTVVPAIKNSTFIRGVGGYSSASPTITTYHFAATFSGDVWTFVACNSFQHTPGGNHGSRGDNIVTTIRGLC